MNCLKILLCGAEATLPADRTPAAPGRELPFPLVTLQSLWLQVVCLLCFLDPPPPYSECGVIISISKVGETSLSEGRLFFLHCVHPFAPPSVSQCSPDAAASYSHGPSIPALVPSFDNLINHRLLRLILTYSNVLVLLVLNVWDL